MKRSIIILLSILYLSSIAKAQDEGLNSNFGIGFQIAQYQQDFGLGINLTSPYFAYDKVAVRVRGNFMWNEHLGNDGLSTWTSYSNVSVGLVGVGGQIGNSIRLYGEGGLLLLFPSDVFSTKSTELGGYGLFGFEFYLNPFSNYFIEIGGVGTGAKEDKLTTKEIYSNGMIIDTGFRFQF